MQEKPDFNNFQGLIRIKDSATPKDLSAQKEAERVMIFSLVHREGKYTQDPYMSENKVLRMRIRNIKKAIIYDDTLEHFIALNRNFGVHLELEDIEKYRTQAKQPGL